MQYFRNNKGFTLVELIAILIIVGILGTFIAKKYIGFTINSGEQVEQLQQTAQDRKDGLYQYAGIEERTEEDAENDVEKTEEKSNSE